MSSNPLLKTKLPYASSAEDLLDKYNYSVKTLNSSYVNTLVDIEPALGIEKFIDIAFNIAANTTATLNHNLGVIPTGWIIIDFVPVSTALAVLTRLSWSTTQINIESRGLIAGNINVVVRVFV